MASFKEKYKSVTDWSLPATRSTPVPVTENQKILTLAEKYRDDISNAVSASQITTRNSGITEGAGVELGEALIEINIV